ncbi:MAG: hypothetical protein ACR2J8_13585 [Thermomicrobiales bacterium]
MSSGPSQSPPAISRRRGIEAALAAIAAHVTPAVTLANAPEDQRRCPPACRGQLGCSGKRCTCGKATGCEIRRKFLIHPGAPYSEFYSNAWDEPNQRLLVTNGAGIRACNQNLGTLWTVNTWAPTPGTQTSFLSLSPGQGDQIVANVFVSNGPSSVSKLIVIDQKRLEGNQPPIWESPGLPHLLGGIEYNQADGLIYATIANDASGVLIFDPARPSSESLVGRWDGTKGTPQFELAIGLSTDAKGLIYVAGANPDGVMGIFCFKPDGKLVRIYGPTTDAGSPLTAADPGVFGIPWAVTVGADGNVYAADPVKAKVHVFASDGTLLASLGRGTQAGREGGIGVVTGVAVNARQQIYTVGYDTSTLVTAADLTRAAASPGATPASDESIGILMKRFVLDGWQGHPSS